MNFYCFRSLESFAGGCCIWKAHTRMGFTLVALPRRERVREVLRPRVFFLNEQQELPPCKRRGLRA
jgi:hypothetical protein